MTQTIYHLVREGVPPGIGLIDLGEHPLKDLVRPEHIYQFAAAGLAAGERLDA